MGKPLEQIWAPSGAKIMVRQWAQQNDSQPQTYEYKNKVFQMATYSSILAWKIPWTEEPGWLLSMGSQRVGHDWMTSLLLVSHWDFEIVMHQKLTDKQCVLLFSCIQSSYFKSWNTQSECFSIECLNDILCFFWFLKSLFIYFLFGCSGLHC